MEQSNIKSLQEQQTNFVGSADADEEQKRRKNESSEDSSEDISEEDLSNLVSQQASRSFSCGPFGFLREETEFRDLCRKLRNRFGLLFV